MGGSPPVAVGPAFTLAADDEDGGVRCRAAGVRTSKKCYPQSKILARCIRQSLIGCRSTPNSDHYIFALRRAQALCQPSSPRKIVRKRKADNNNNNNNGNNNNHHNHIHNHNNIIIISIITIVIITPVSPLRLARRSTSRPDLFIGCLVWLALHVVELELVGQSIAYVTVTYVHVVLYTVRLFRLGDSNARAESSSLRGGKARDTV